MRQDCIAVLTTALSKELKLVVHVVAGAEHPFSTGFNDVSSICVEVADSVGIGNVQALSHFKPSTLSLAPLSKMLLKKLLTHEGRALAFHPDPDDIGKLFQLNFGR